MTLPRQWSHGDQPTHTMMNLYGTSLTEAHTWLGDVALNPGHLKGSEATYYLLHTYRYLHFMSNGQIEDITGTNAPVSISEDESGYGVTDLENIGWLAYGAAYKVTGVSVCCEDMEP